MHLTNYHFDGDPKALEAGYQRMMAAFPTDELLLNICIAREGGITVVDTCTTREDAEAFAAGDTFAGALADAGLPTPRVEPVGDIRAVYGYPAELTV
jgi:hypothetical protein